MVEKISLLMSEHRHRKNKLDRFWRRLSVEAVKIAKERGIDILASNEPADGKVEGRIYLFHNGEYDDSSLVGLAKSEMPALYRRYQDGLQKHKESLWCLEEYLGSIQAALL